MSSVTACAYAHPHNGLCGCPHGTALGRDCAKCGSPPRPQTKTYLGDAVYAELDQFGGIVLTTEDGIRATNTIVLEPEVLNALIAWLEVLKRSMGGE